LRSRRAVEHPQAKRFEVQLKRLFPVTTVSALARTPTRCRVTYSGTVVI
jgi:hypothetical protein